VDVIVRCGRCKVELEVQGAGEFTCPSCGTRNSVRGAAGQSPFGVPDLGGLGQSAPAPEPGAGIVWVQCPSCSYRFAVGDVSSVTCPTCGADTPVPARDDAVAE